jgi:hypothetical protein
MLHRACWITNTQGTVLVASLMFVMLLVICQSSIDGY